MKKLLLVALTIVTLLVAAPAAYAREDEQRGHENEYEYNDDHGRRHGGHGQDDLYVDDHGRNQGDHYNGWDDSYNSYNGWGYTWEPVTYDDSWRYGSYSWDDSYNNYGYWGY